MQRLSVGVAPQTDKGGVNWNAGDLDNRAYSVKSGMHDLKQEVEIAWGLRR